MFFLARSVSGDDPFVQAIPIFGLSVPGKQNYGPRIEMVTGLPVVSITYDGTVSRINDAIVPYLQYTPARRLLDRAVQSMPPFNGRTYQSVRRTTPGPVRSVVKYRASKENAGHMKTAACWSKQNIIHVLLFETDWRYPIRPLANTLRQFFAASPAPLPTKL